MWKLLLLSFGVSSFLVSCDAQHFFDVDLSIFDVNRTDERRAREAVANCSFIFYFGKNSSDQLNVSLDNIEEITNHSRFNNDRPTTIYLHGYANTQRTPAMKKIVEAYTKFDGHNLVVLDWAKSVDGSYLNAYANVQPIAKKIATILLDAFRRQILKIPLVYLVGHSLGAQLGGTIGRNVIQQSKQETHLHRITGLDPAGPLFFPDLPIILEENHLTEKDAEFVDIIHTDSGGYGYPLQTGSADFFVNSGHRFQPGCGTENQKGGSCSHNRAVDFWAESVLRNASFYAVSVEHVDGQWSNSWEDFKLHKIDTDSLVLMGIACPDTADGRYYLQTNRESPFGRGVKSIYYNKSIEETDE